MLCCCVAFVSFHVGMFCFCFCVVVILVIFVLTYLFCCDVCGGFLEVLCLISASCLFCVCVCVCVSAACLGLSIVFFSLCCLQCTSQPALQLLDPWQYQPATIAAMSHCIQSLDNLLAQVVKLPFTFASKFSTLYQHWASLCGIAHYCCFTCVLPKTAFAGWDWQHSFLQKPKTLSSVFGLQGAVLPVPPRFSNRVIIAPGPSATSYGQNAIVANVYL